MTLLFMDGFDVPHTYAPGDALWYDSDAYLTGPSTNENQSTTARTGGAWKLVASNARSMLIKNVGGPPANAILYGGFAVRIDQIMAAGMGIFAVGANVSFDLHASIGINDNNQLAWFTGAPGTGLLMTHTEQLTIGAWNYVEWYLKIDNSAGEVGIKLNGGTAQQAISKDTYDGINTATVTYLGLIGYPATGFTGTIYFDDFIICDDQGSVNNSYPGQPKIELLTPNADGNYSQWTSTEANDYSAIDDFATGDPDGDTTKVSSSTAADDVSVGLAATGTAGTVLGVQLVVNAKAENSDAPFTPFWRIGASETPLTSIAPGDAYGYFTQISEQNPETTAAWTTSDLDDLELGFAKD